MILVYREDNIVLSVWRSGYYIIEDYRNDKSDLYSGNLDFSDHSELLSMYHSCDLSTAIYGSHRAGKIPIYLVSEDEYITINDIRNAPECLVELVEFNRYLINNNFEINETTYLDDEIEFTNNLGDVYVSF